MLGGLSEILSVLALVGFSAVTLWLLARPVARMGVLMPTPRMLTLAAAATALWCAGEAEVVEGRPLTKENIMEPNTQPTQSGEGCPKG